MTKKKQDKKLRCYFFKANVFTHLPAETIVGYVVEANKGKAHDWIEARLYDNFASIVDLLLVHIPRDERITFMLAVDLDKEEEVRKMVEEIMKSNTSEFFTTFYTEGKEDILAEAKARNRKHCYRSTAREKENE